VVWALRAIHRRTRHCIANQDSDSRLVGDSSYDSGNRRSMVNNTIAKMEQSRTGPAAIQQIQEAIFVVAVAAHLCAFLNAKIQGNSLSNGCGHVPLHMRRWWGLPLPRTVPASSSSTKELIGNNPNLMYHIEFEQSVSKRSLPSTVAVHSCELCLKRSSSMATRTPVISPPLSSLSPQQLHGKRA
jgi:hypothetical protein